MQTKQSFANPKFSFGDLAAIIPTLNEEKHLAACLESLIEAGLRPNQICVCDGGSNDRTWEIAREYKVITLSSRPGRAQQMNLGAQTVSARCLLFLHADTKIPAESLDLILQSLAEGNLAGCFKRRFETNSLWLRLTSRLAAWRAKHFGIAYGDQGFWIQSELFHQLGSYPDIPIFEDVELSLRAHSKSPLNVINATLLTSARRFAKGTISQTLKDFWETILYYRSR